MSDYPWKACPECGHIRRGKLPEGFANDVCEQCLSEGHRYRMLTLPELEFSVVDQRMQGYQITADRRSSIALALQRKIQHA